ncbi:hypothetical protein LBMAG49_25090 [Planctomycetota bacterium]|nr:hypothetical protein LBMAG49_25090 [Planctomycetota bacterium]
MINPDDLQASFSELMEVRASLRCQEIRLCVALRSVQREISSWREYCSAEAVARRASPKELAILWEELETRERELAMDIVQVGAALAGACAAISKRLHATSRAS